ncbi:hypothetical protein PYCC9005_001676 [Savitreella phatthalungensis]
MNVLFSTQQTTNMLVALYYSVPALIGAYYLAASIIATCLLHKGSRAARYPRRRLCIITLLILSCITLLIEAIQLADAVLDARSGQDAHAVSVVLRLVIYTLLAVNLSSTKNPVWHPYLGSCTLALVAELTLAAFQQNVPAYLRIVCLAFVLVISTTIAMDSRPKRIMLEDVPSAGLTASTDTLLDPEETDSDDEDEDVQGFLDSDNEGDPDIAEDHKQLRKEQRKRLRASGSWFAYLSNYRIFLPMLWPRNNLVVQFCFATAGVCIIACRILNVLVPRQLGLVGDQLARGESPWSSVTLWAIYYALNSFIGFPLLREIVQVPVRYTAFQNIVTTAFRHIMHLSMDFHNDKSSGELIRAIDQGSELHDLLEFVFVTALPTFFDLAIALVYVYVLFDDDVYMALVLLLMGTAYMLVGAKVNGLSTQLLRDHNTAIAESGRIQNEAISSWHTVSHFNRGEHECARYQAVTAKQRKAATRYYIAWNAAAGVQSAALTAGYIAATILAAHRVATGRTPVGRFITLATYWTSIEDPLWEVTYSVRKISQMLTNSERLLKLLTTKASVVDAPDAQPLELKRGEVVFRNVAFSYDPRRPVIRDISFVAKRGQTVALVGETGGGKSTLLKLLYRYFDVSSGAITIDDQDVRSVTLDSLREAFAYVPQDPALFNFSLRENLRYARLDATDAEIENACRAAAVHDRIMSLPDGYDTEVGERGVKLSGGELQRVAIARALLRDSPIVLLDEATSMVDAHTEHLIQQALSNLARNRTAFVVAHRLSTIRQADLIIVVRDGQIVERGTHDQLIEASKASPTGYGYYAALWTRQAGM